jgi:hypothetical protein
MAYTPGEGDSEDCASMAEDTATFLIRLPNLIHLSAISVPYLPEPHCYLCYTTGFRLPVPVDQSSVDGVATTAS